MRMILLALFSMYLQVEYSYFIPWYIALAYAVYAVMFDFMWLIKGISDSEVDCK